MVTLNFRYDINGLRAIAVIAVVLFHFKSNWLQGGFAGVDVFFVISGFLMTGIIFKGFDNNNFSLFKFYTARANRIIPALTVLCITVLFLGWFLINPIDYGILGKHAASSIGFFSNETYLAEAGYFDRDSQEKWLLHTWSLSVEWQFYILYPLILIGLRALISKNNLKRSILLFSFFGFLVSVYVGLYKTELSYYSLVTRFWEMTLGGIAYLYPLSIARNPKTKITLEWLGWVLILGSYLLVSKENIWPGYLALFPVLGTYLVIQANNQNSLMTSNILLQAIGRWSYSIYLWHWPIAVYGVYFNISEWWIIGIPLSVLCGWLSHKYIESYSFKRKTNWSEILGVKPIWMLVVILLLGNSIHNHQPNAYLFPLPQTVTESMDRKGYACFDKQGMHEESPVVCELFKGDRNILVLGDSHAYSILPALEDIAIEERSGLYYNGYSGCPPLLGVHPLRKDQNEKNCHLLNKRSFSYAANNEIDVVFLAARWTYYTEGNYEKKSQQFLSLTSTGNKDRINSLNAFEQGLTNSLKFLKEKKIRAVILLQVPMQEEHPNKLYYSSIVSGELSKDKLHAKSIELNKHKLFQLETNEIIRRIADEFDAYIIDPTDQLCNKKTCPIGTTKSSYYYDDDHISVMGGKTLKSAITVGLNL